jgi:PPP family 3-phenylpropionic acid transporter
MVSLQGAVPYWRLSGFYLFYFASLGALIPYWGLYLKGLGFDPEAIGELMAVIMATKVVAPNVWGWIADHFGQRMRIVQLGSLAALVCFAGVFLGGGYGWLALVMTLFSFFWNAVLPQFEAVTLSHLGPQVQRYAAIRLWGSVGFILVVAGLGPVLDRLGTALLPGVLLALFAGIWASSLAVPQDRPPTPHAQPGSLRRVLRRPEVLVFLTVCFLMQASHGPYYTFYTLYLEGHGYSRSLIGQLWALGVAAEIGLFLVTHRVLPSLGAQRLLLLSLGLAALRWAIIAVLPTELAAMVFAQLLHAASFGAYHAAAIHLVHHLFVGRHQGRGQALYSSLSFGAGGAVGSLLSGYLWVTIGPGWVYAIASGVALGALVLAWGWLPRGPQGATAHPLEPGPSA